MKKKKKKKKKSYAVTAVAVGWSALVCSQLWPPISILIPEHLRDFKQLVVGLLTCSCFFGRGRHSAAEAARRARKRRCKKERRRMRRYYKSSGDTASFSDDEDDDDTDSDDDEDEDTDSDGDSSYSKGDSDRRCGGCEGGDRCGSQGSCFDGTVLGSVAPGREHKRQGDAAAAASTMARSSGSRGSRDTLSSAGGGGSTGDLSSYGTSWDARAASPDPIAPAAGAAAVASAPARGPSAAARREEEEDKDAVAAAGPSVGGGGGGARSGSGRLLRSTSSLRRGAALAGDARAIATLLVPTPASFAIWLIDLFVLGALIAAAVIDAQRAEIALHKTPAEF